MKPATPPHHTGARSDTTHSITVATSQQAEALFTKARKNLLTVNAWEQLAGSLSASFQLADKTGKTVRRIPAPGDYFKIELPGPEDTAEHHYDWVQVEKVEEDLQNPLQAYTYIQVRPAQPPQGQQKTTSHFFTNEATSTFSVERNNNTITAAVYGRNEKPNTRQVGLLTKIRNVIIGLLAMIGLNKPQWASLVKGILEKDADAITFQK